MRGSLAAPIRPVVPVAVALGVPLPVGVALGVTVADGDAGLLTRSLRAPPTLAPRSFDTYYEYGAMVQTWGSVPRCNLTDPAASCQDKETGADVCCTESCQVVALPETVSTPSVTLVNADDISQGIQVRWLWLAGVLRRRRVQKTCWQWRRGVARPGP